ncbi:MAG: diacylglycerol kinase family protein [Candidatus Kerfeldbacteria bacterium]
MYFYFYDKFTADKQYEQVLTLIETRLIELGINGRVEKLSIFKNARELIEDGIKKGAHTVVAVGDDRTFATLVNIVAPYDVTLGYIPMIEGSRFAEVLGIPTGEEACTTLSRRLFTTTDLGKVNDYYFLGSVELPSHTNLKITCDKQYTVQTTSDTNRVRVMNMGDILGEGAPRLAYASDGKLELVISPVVEGGMLRRKKKHSGVKESVFPVTHIDVDADGETLSVNADGVSTINTPCEIDVVTRSQKIIVGKDRQIESDSN